jgi:hypothetical protein
VLLAVRTLTQLLGMIVLEAIEAVLLIAFGLPIRKLLGTREGLRLCIREANLARTANEA